jgi:two-component system, OmpR family, response regulator
METKDRIFIVEDDLDIRQLLRDYMEQNGFDAVACNGGAEMDRKLLELGEPSLIILDLMMPGEDGLSICRRLRAMTNIPLLMLTAKADEVDRIVGLEMGADDYLAKPFNPRELLARVRAIMRRSVAKSAKTEQLKLGSLTMDRALRCVRSADGNEIVLTSAEFDLLECFVTRPGRILSRDQLMDWTRGRPSDAFDRTIDVQLSRLRKKVETGSEPMFKTIRNQGYVLIAAVKDQ